MAETGTSGLIETLDDGVRVGEGRVLLGRPHKSDESVCHPGSENPAVCSCRKVGSIRTRGYAISFVECGKGRGGNIVPQNRACAVVPVENSQLRSCSPATAINRRSGAFRAAQARYVRTGARLSIIVVANRSPGRQI